MKNIKKFSIQDANIAQIVLKKTLLFFILVLVEAFLTGCSSGKQSNSSSSDIRKISINPNSREIGKLTMSEIVESITYIPLETKDECLIGTVAGFIFSENYMLLSCGITKRCYLFSRTGHFIAQIGDIGQGPGEYTTFTSFININEKNDQVIIHNLTPDQLLYYDLTGRFIKSIPLEHDSRIMSYHNGFYLLKDRNRGNTPNSIFGNTSYSYTILDEDFSIITQKIQPKSFVMNPPNHIVARGAAFCQYIYDNQVHVRENMLNDTLYRINHDFDFIPKYIVNAGKYEMTVEIRSNAELFVREAKNTLTINFMFETKDYLLLSYMFKDEFNMPCYYHKKEDKLLYFSSTSGIPNDYDGGLDFWPRYQNNNQLITFINANRIEEHRSSSNKMMPQGTPEAISHFEQMSRKLDPEDNPVMVIVTLK